MLIAMLAMMAMVVVPTSCGDDDDDDNGTKTSSNSLKGKMFIDENETMIDILVFDNDVAYYYYCEKLSNQYEEGTDTDKYEILSSGLISWDHDLFKYENGKLYEYEDGEYDEWMKEISTTKKPTELISEWKASHPLKY